MYNWTINKGESKSTPCYVDMKLLLDFRPNITVIVRNIKHLSILAEMVDYLNGIFANELTEI